MTRALALMLAACVSPPIVQAPISIVVQPAPVPSCSEERVLVDDALQSFIVDAGAD